MKHGELAAGSGWPTPGPAASLTLDRLASLEEGFTAENLMAAVTQMRMESVLWAFVTLSNQNQRSGRRAANGPSPSDEAKRGRRKTYQGKPAPKDAWVGTTSSSSRDLPRRRTPRHPQFDDFVLASAGPDGKFGTPDDLAFRNQQQGDRHGSVAGRAKPSGGGKAAALRDTSGDGG
ncbi:MAG: hypothetical protein U0797_20475 [Gemmataceae bacterium]